MQLGRELRALKRTVLNSVLTAPGLTALTRTAVPTRSCRAQSVKPRMKCFVPQYTEPGRTPHAPLHAYLYPIDTWGILPLAQSVVSHIASLKTAGC